ncbi:GNAT family N-acetyltransferase [Neptuniibacter sp. QD57_21]|uniref:GNAT family N-acetyltransferase n=1 Tax=Neptuniibacter sp. QD57_21 TaxID=3398213 RepID=UPI0039F4B8DC
MHYLEYVKFTEIEPLEFLPVLNKRSTREHLIAHELFDLEMVTDWIQGKIKVDATEGCRVRAIKVKNTLAGWCGIQLEEGKYEIAIVIDDSFWGIGKQIFREIMRWAKELGHKTIFIHFLHTRPEYKFLKKLSKNVYESELMGSKFMTYELEVEKQF